MEMPRCEDSEKSILSAIIFERDVFFEVETIIDEFDFYFERNRVIFKTMVFLNNEKKSFDIDLISRYCKKYLVVEASYFVELFNHPVALNPTQVAKQIKEYSLRRKIIADSNNIMQKAIDDTNNIEDIVDEAQSKFLDLKLSSEKDVIYTPDEIRHSTIESIKNAQKGNGLKALKTGFNALDLCIEVSGSKLIVVAGRPGMGKTSFAISMMRNMVNNNHSVGFLSLEMSKEEIDMRLITIETGLSEKKLLTKGLVKGNEMGRIEHTTQLIAGKKIYISDIAPATIEDVERRCRKMKRLGCDIIFIDQLSCIKGNGRTSLYELFSVNCNRIARLKKELKIPIVLLTQINRDVEKRTDKAPILADLKQTGSIEEDSDIVILLYRPNYYEKSDDYNSDSKVVIEVAKNRQGRTVVLVNDIKWDGSRMLFHENHRVTYA